MIKNRFFEKKLKIQINVFMIMLTRSSNWIFNPMRYTDIIILRIEINYEKEKYLLREIMNFYLILFKS